VRITQIPKLSQSSLFPTKVEGSFTTAETVYQTALFLEGAGALQGLSCNPYVTVKLTIDGNDVFGELTSGYSSGNLGISLTGSGPGIFNNSNFRHSYPLRFNKSIKIVVHADGTAREIKWLIFTE